MLHPEQLYSSWQLLVKALFEQLFQTPKIEGRGKCQLGICESLLMATEQCSLSKKSHNYFFYFHIPFFSFQN